MPENAIDHIERFTHMDDNQIIFTDRNWKEIQDNHLHKGDNNDTRDDTEGPSIDPVPNDKITGVPDKGNTWMVDNITYNGASGSQDVLDDNYHIFEQ